MNNNEIYDLKYTLAEYILPRLEAFKEKVDKNEAPTIPIFKDDSTFLGDRDNIDELSNYWSKRLEEMIFPFEYYVFPEKHDALEFDEINKKFENGMKIFAKYFHYLSI
ncbi:hypothetical protein [Chryseobacterium sp. 3008163]|uniref:hypothetical protein n=1 Tax=Chryseobacterium sp. 3008163 TaxID=2478663 RepID=UPI000F0BFABE|nr:hypothetical protein [Chryseobacterium sp. 3008163]AYM99601.1 hypothetical protein EAG08_03940 [Chryseobacterium sp. 3008163]